MDNTTTLASQLKYSEITIGLELISMCGLIPLFVLIQILLRKYLGIRLYSLGRYIKTFQREVEGSEHAVPTNCDVDAKSNGVAVEYSGESIYIIIYLG